MKKTTSEKLRELAAWLDDTNNNILVGSEDNELVLAGVAFALAGASDLVKSAADDISEQEPENELTAEKLEELAAVAAAFDESGDELLMKQASTIDEILLTIATPKGAVLKAKKAAEEKIDQIKKKYKSIKEELDEINHVSEAVDALAKSETFKPYRVLEAPLSTRTCIDHPGAQLQRVGEHVWQCAMDHKIYNYETGFKTLDGRTVPGGDVAAQTLAPSDRDASHIQFDDRNSRLGIM
jgi:superfamily I DNA and/or RNA helicase